MMKYSTTSKKSVQEVVDAIIKHAETKEFDVTNVYDVSGALDSKGVSFSDECKVLDICNPHHVLNLLSTTMDMSMLLPCKVSVYTQDNVTQISMIKPKQLYQNFTHRLDDVADELEKEMIEIIDASK